MQVNFICYDSGWGSGGPWPTPRLVSPQPWLCGTRPRQTGTVLP
jgi:hypothetical protein